MIGMDFGNTKMCVASIQFLRKDLHYLDFGKREWINIKENKTGILLPVKFFLDYVDRSILIGHEALGALQNPEKVSLLSQGNAGFVSYLKSKIYLDHEVSCRLIRTLFQWVALKILNLSMDDKFFILSIPPMASKEYGKILKKSNWGMQLTPVIILVFLYIIYKQFNKNTPNSIIYPLLFRGHPT